MDGSTLDIIQTHKPKSFQKTSAAKTGLRDGHKMFVTFLKAYRDYKKSDQNDFPHELDQEMIKGTFDDKSDQYESFFNLLSLRN